VTGVPVELLGVPIEPYYTKDSYYYSTSRPKAL